MAFIIPFATIALSNPQIGKWRCSSTAVDFPQERDQNPNKQKESERFWGAAGARPFARWGWCPLSRALFMRAAPAHPAALTATGERCPHPTGAGFFVRCRGLLAPVRLAGWLRLALPQPQAKPLTGKHAWPFSTASHIWPVAGGRVPQGGALALPPSSRPAQFFAEPRSFVMRPVCALLAGLSFLSR